MATDLARRLRAQDLEMRQMFADAVDGPGYREIDITAEVFHQTLSLAHDRNWIRPKDLASRLKWASEPNVRKWFKTDPSKRSTPNAVTMERVLREVARLMNERIEADERARADERAEMVSTYDADAEPAPIAAAEAGR